MSGMKDPFSRLAVPMLLLSTLLLPACSTILTPRANRAVQRAAFGNAARFAATLLTPVAGHATTKRLDAQTHKPRFEGEAKFLWVSPNLFWFEQAGDPGQRLRYVTVHPTTKAPLVIEPEDMFFDGASVPRWLWEVDSLGPFDYTYAALIHDWIFEAHHRHNIYANAAGNKKPLRHCGGALKPCGTSTKTTPGHA